MDTVFYDRNGDVFPIDLLEELLREIGADDCRYLFIHSDVMFGFPGTGFNRRGYLGELWQIIDSLDVELIIPTFTYSFPNHEVYDVVNSKTLMGSFNEYARKQNERYRTMDPLLSLSVPESIKGKFVEVSNHSLGKGSGLDVVHGLDGVKFLFLGAEMGDCFTYVHYVEKMMDVPYRFDMSFCGTVIDYEGKEETRIQSIHTQCGGVKLPPKYDYFEREMEEEEKGYLRKRRFADKYIACISEEDAYREIKKHIESNKYYFVAEPYTEKDLTKIYTYDSANGKITHC